MTEQKKSIPSVIGILGGGQLGRMTAMAAAKLGIKTVIFEPQADCPASHVSYKHFAAPYEDVDKLREFAQLCDVITLEFENVPVQTVRYLQTLKPVYPGDKLLDIAQNRLKEKEFLNEIGIKTAHFSPVSCVDDIEKFRQDTDLKEFIIKTNRFGYDGKGQYYHRDGQDLQSGWQSLGTNDAIVESVIDFECEVSVIVARSPSGSVKAFPPVMNDHEGGILRQTTYPAPISDTVQSKAIEAATLLANAVDLGGLLTLEMFVTRDGDIRANEIAPRSHNSGHWTMDACAISQFDMHVRAICDLPLLDPTPLLSATMYNLIGDDMQQISKYLTMDKACLHLYGKDEVKPGRKMGHVTILGE